MRCILILLFVLLASPFQALSKSITIKIDAEESKKHKVYMSVFTQSEGFPDQAKKAKRNIVLEPGKQQITIRLKEQTLALSAFIDTNGNKALDKNSLGIPTEPIGFSSNPTLVFSAPDFDSSAIELKETSTVINMKFKTY